MQSNIFTSIYSLFPLSSICLKFMVLKLSVEQDKFEAIVAGPSTAQRGRGARRRVTRGTRQWTVTTGMPYVQHPPTTSTYNGVSLGSQN